MKLDEAELVAALPGYEIGAELGRGGWGVVLGARHRRLGREVAIKQLPRAFAADPAVQSRFVAEARLLASLDHPHIVPIYDYVEQDGLCLLVMEKLPGGTVWNRFTGDGLTPATACALVLATCAGLHAAHERRILHRDIKPENLMFSESGALKVTDFGIAKVVGGDDTMATKAGEVVGTPAYMAPEQAQGGALTPATDIYAVATMLYELLAGDLPFADDGDALALLFKHAFEAPTPLREKASLVPASVAGVVMQGLATDPSNRYTTAESFALALAEACTASWGPGWLTAETVPLMGSNAVMAVTERMTGAANVLTTDPAGRAAPGTRVSAPVGSASAQKETVVRGSSPESDAASTPLPPVRRTGTVRAVGARLIDVDAEALVPVREVITPPPAGVVPALAGVALLLVAVVLSFVGLAKPSTGGTIDRSGVTVAGLDPVSGVTVPLDLSQPVPITVTAHAGKGIDGVRLAFLIGNHQVLTDSASLGRGARSTDIDVGSSRYLLAGKVTAELSLVEGGKSLAAERFGVKLKQPVYLSAPGVAGIILLLVVVAYAESLLRSLRRGRRVVAPLIGMIVLGALAGVVASVAAWLLAGVQPMVATVIVSSVVGIGAGVALAMSGIQLGRRRRFRFTRQV